MLPADANDPMDPIEKADPTDPMEQNDPTDPIERMDSRDPMLSSEFTDRADHLDVSTDSLMRIIMRGRAGRAPSPDHRPAER